MSIHLFLIVILLAGTTTAQSNATSLTLNRNISVSLAAQTIYAYQVMLPSDIPTNYDFFLVVQWPSSDPLQYPFIDITTGDGNYITCYKSDNQFSGVCSIPSQKLLPNATITTEVYCFVQCTLTITPLLQKRLKIGFSESHSFTASANSGMPLEIEIQIPYDLNFTQVAFYVQIDSMEKAKEGLEMYGNVGDENTPIPSKKQFDYQGESVYWGGKGIFLSKQDIKVGQFVKLYVYLSEGMSVKLYSNYMNANNFMIELGKTYYDYTTFKENKVYLLDLRKMGNITDQTIQIGFLVYSGSPYVTIALESSFLHPIQQLGSVSTSTYLITESVRKQYNYSGIIFIKVESIWSANYVVFSGINQKNFISIFPDITLFNELEAKDVYNYFFDDLVAPDNATANESTTLRSYSIRVNMIKGHITLGIRRCKSAEEGSSVLSCVINSAQSLSNSSLKATFQDIDITMKTSEDYYYMSFQYDAKKCSKLNITATNYKYYCSFHIVALEAVNKSADYTITLNKRLYTNTLLEGALSRDFIYEDEYLYFRFIVGNLDEVVAVTFFTTLIEGDIYLMVSMKDQFPSMETKSSDLYFSVGNSITLTKEQLASTIYIGVYGIQLSEFTLGVKVSRKAISPSSNTTNTPTSNTTGNATAVNTTSETSETRIGLRLDLSQQFTIEQKDTSVVFLISTPSTMNVTTEIMQIAGSVTLQVRDGNKTVNCTDKKSTNNKVTCTFLSKEKTTYTAIVSGKKGETQKFIIIYHKEEACLAYTLNLPLFLEFDSGEKSCTTYSVTKLIDLQVTATVPLKNLLDQSLHMIICLNENCLPPTVSHHTKITKNQLISYCNFAKKNSSNVFQSCPIKISFTTASSISFEVIVEEDGKDIGLFDGIVEKINTFDLTQQNGKYFFYEIYQKSAVKVYLTCFTSFAFYVALHFVEEGDFLNNATKIYLPFRETNYDMRQKFEDNFFETIVYGSNTKILTISASVVQKYCNECFLTIAIYPQYQQAHQLSFFEIEVTQTETMLYMGSSKLGYLEADDIYNYQLQHNSDSDALLSITDLSKQSNKQQPCFTGSLASNNSDALVPVDNGLAYIKKGSVGSNLYVEAKSDVCNYEVSYMRVDFPLIIASANKKYQIKARSSDRLFFLYTHNSPQSFKITQIVNTGSLTLFGNPVGNSSVQQLIKADHPKLAFISNDNDGTFQVSNKSTAFCSGCQYLIVVLAKSDVVAQIIITRYNASIPLSVNGIIKDKIVVSELGFRNYTFNAITAFNVSISPIYGTLKVTVIDPSKKVISTNNISTTTVLSIPHNKNTQSYSFDFESYYTEYNINIEAPIDSKYSIRASKENLTSRLFEGIPLYYTFNAGQTIELQFLNLNNANATSNSLNILVDITENKANNTPNLNVTASFEGKEGQAPVNLPINNVAKADSTYNIEIPLKIGTYYIKITLDSAVQTSIILAKQSFIHLKPSTSVVLFKEGMFQLYSKSKGAMIEVFACQGDLTVDASSYYKDFSASGKQYGQIIVEQNNYGGHYVINAENIYGEYFINVRNKKREADMGYMITYYYYDTKDALPYKFINLYDREITYTLNKTAVTFSFSPISINWDDSDSIDSVYIEYIIYVADNKNKVNKYANCRLGEVYYAYARQKGGSVEASIDLTKINEIIGDMDIYFMGAEAIVYIDPSELADKEYPQQLNLIYQTIELSNVKIPISQQQSGTSYSVQMIILWFLMPFAIAGIILYFALKYCIKKYRGLLPNELIEEVHGESEQGVHLPDSSPFGNNPSNPNDASQELKDHV